MKRKTIFFALLAFSLCLSLSLVSTLSRWAERLDQEGPITLEPSPEPSPLSERTPVAAEEISTLDLLTRTVVPERDLYRITARLKKIGQPIKPTINERPLRYEIGDQVTFWVFDYEAKTNFPISATLRCLTDHAYMWVQEDAAVDAEGLKKSAQVFEEGIYPTNHRYFGQEWSPGVDNDPRISILNARAPGGVVGSFASADEYPKVVNPFSNQREMVFLNLNFVQPGTADYDSVLAHEFQHMIHWHADRNEDSWINEGASQLAEKLNGYDDGFLSAFANSPDTQLNTWSDQLGANAPHYGGAYLFIDYFTERFGEGYLRDLVAEKADGIEGLNQVLADHQTGLSFEDVFKDWLIANYLDDPSLADGRYGYHDLDCQVSLDQTHTDYPARQESSVHQYAADYIELGQSSGQPVELVIDFEGATEVKLVPNEPHSGRYQWWSNRGDGSDTTLTRAFDLTGLSEATLEAWLWYDIEEDWDYAYIEVSTDGGQTWDTLPGKYTTTANPTGNNFGHGYTGKSGIERQGSRRGKRETKEMREMKELKGFPQFPLDPFADSQQATWVREEIDLTPYVGQEVLLRFEHITDDAVNNVGFVIDDIAIPQLGYADDAEGGQGGWVAEGFIRSDNVIPQRFLVQLIEFGEKTSVREMPLDKDQRGRLVIEGFGEEVERAVLVIAAAAPVTTEVANYRYEVTLLFP